MRTAALLKVSVVAQCSCLLVALAACTRSAEPEPVIPREASNAEEDAKKAKREAERQQDLVIQEAKQQLPIPSGPNTIEVPVDMDELDKRILKGESDAK